MSFDLSSGSITKTLLDKFSHHSPDFNKVNLPNKVYKRTSLKATAAKLHLPGLPSLRAGGLGAAKPRVRPKVYPTSRWRAARWERRRLNVPILQPPLSLAPSCPLRSPPIICPDGRAHGPNEPFGTERKEGANCSCDVGVVPFTAFAMATGHGPCKHAAPLLFSSASSGLQRGAAGSLSLRSLITKTQTAIFVI